MINSARIEFLMNRYEAGNISQEEYLELIDQLKANGNDAAFFNAMDKLWENTAAETFHTKADEAQIYQRLIQNEAFKPKTIFARLKPLYRYAAAAVILIVLSVSIYTYFNNNSLDKNRFAANDITPGGNKAMLILSDGKKIDLTVAANGELLSQSGISVSKTADGQLIYNIKNTPNAGDKVLENTIVTPKGGQYQVNLPDGSKVWLNASSSLKFPLQFKANERAVMLTGEAYFEVAKKIKGDKGKERLPFYVETPSQRVEVLGTHFNVNAYESEPAVKTTLLEGAVKVVSFKNAKNSTERISYLSPGQQAIVNGVEIKVVQADIEETMGWKNGLFVFNGQNLEGIMREVERWYNVDVVFEDEALRKDAFNGSTSRFKNISQLLEVLESTGSVHFKIEGRRITVMD